MQPKQLPLTSLCPHPLNSNVMDADQLKKLVAHIKRTHQYPPLIVRKLTDKTYQLLDGHHRLLALKKLNYTHAACTLWENIDDTQALVLLTTLNRLQGCDNPKKRGQLFAQIEKRLGDDFKALARTLPETLSQARKLIEAVDPPTAPRPPVDLSELPTAVCFFLSGEQKGRFGALLERFGSEKGAKGSEKEHFLMHLIDVYESKTRSVTEKPRL